MKKYVKPDVAFEGFELSQHIAGGCSALLNSADVNSCSTTGKGEFDGMDVGLFAQGYCEVPFETSVWENISCYYNGTSAINFFNS